MFLRLRHRYHGISLEYAQVARFQIWSVFASILAASLRWLSRRPWGSVRISPTSSRRLRFAVQFCTCIVCALTIVTLGRCSPLQALNGICSVPHNIRRCLTGLMQFLYFLFKIMLHLGLEHWYTDKGRKFKLVLIILDCMKDLIKPMICLSLKKVNEDNFPFKFFFKC